MFFFNVCYTFLSISSSSCLDWEQQSFPMRHRNLTMSEISGPQTLYLSLFTICTYLKYIPVAKKCWQIGLPHFESEPLNWQTHRKGCSIINISVQRLTDLSAGGLCTGHRCHGSRGDFHRGRGYAGSHSRRTDNVITREQRAGLE